MSQRVYENAICVVTAILALVTAIVLEDRKWHGVIMLTACSFSVVLCVNRENIRQFRFWVGFGVAALLHILLLWEFVGSKGLYPSVILWGVFGVLEAYLLNGIVTFFINSTDLRVKPRV